MHVDTAMAGQVQHVWPQDLAESHHDDQVGLPGLQLGHCLRFAQPPGLYDRDIQIPGEQLDWGWGEHLASAGRAVWLGDDPDDRIACGQGIQCMERELGRSHEYNCGLHGEILAQVG